MRGFSWTHLILAILIIVFAFNSNMTFVIVLAAIMAVLSIFGACTCSNCNPRTVKKTRPKKKVKRKKAKKRRK